MSFHLCIWSRAWHVANTLLKERTVNTYLGNMQPTLCTHKWHGPCKGKPCCQVNAL